MTTERMDELQDRRELHEELSRQAWNEACSHLDAGRYAEMDLADAAYNLHIKAAMTWHDTLTRELRIGT